MKRSDRVYLIPILFLLCFLEGCRSEAEVRFNRDIRPILNAKCVSCHGGVKRAGGLNLLFRTEALGPGESGRPTLVPGDAGSSELMARVRHPDPEKRMPKKGPPLEEKELELLEAWIDQGAEWADHWAYVPPAPVEIPEVDGTWPVNGIDSFILRRLREEGLEPAPESDREIWMRRASLDLTGLPPTPEEVEAFVSDSSPRAYEKVVDRLLASPRYGERWAALWLDLARYADTKGYERDPEREIWRYRDWLIQAFNRDLPFDEFTVEQLAGDMLPNPSPDQYVATAFHRNTMNNDEGGTDNEEYRVAAVIDRVNTTWDVWMGTTFGCVQCHGHPFDPFRQEEYYEVLSFFNNSRDEDTPYESPVYRFFEPEDGEKLERIRKWAREKTGGFEQDKEEAVRRIEELLHFAEPKLHPHYFEILENGTHADTKYLEMYRDGVAVLPGVDLRKKSRMLIRFNWSLDGTRVEIRRDSPEGELLRELRLSKADHKGHVFFDIPPAEGTHDLYFLFHNSKLEKEKGAVSISWLMFLEPLPGSDDPEYPAMERLVTELLNRETDSVPIMVENGPEVRRRTQIFERGNWLVKGREVEPGVPDSLPPLPGEAGRTRLDFARWVASTENPLTARVAVNRFWEQLFGTGLVETVEDFGTQGMPPSHPELLDWLALRFMEELDWSVKRLLRDMVLSSTYRQSAVNTPEKRRKDPANRLLSRGPRVRLTAEQVRDQALAVSGLLSDKMYGPSVMPPQPEGVWQIIYSDEKWETSPGEDRYRRALYTYWRRTSPYPSMVLFDAPSREFCVPRRLSTNTPLQALVTLNDPAFVEAASALAERMMETGGPLAQKIEVGYRWALGRRPGSDTLDDLESLYREARQILEEGTASDPQREAERKALTAVANAIMNLDEFLTK